MGGMEWMCVVYRLWRERGIGEREGEGEEEGERQTEFTVIYDRNPNYSIRKIKSIGFICRTEFEFSRMLLR